MPHALRLATLAVLLANLARAGQPAFDAAIVYRSGSEVYDQAVAGLRAALTGAPYRIEYIDLTHAQPDFPAGPPRLLVSIGVGAWQQLKSGAPSLQTLPALILRQELNADPARTAGAVYLDIPLITIAEQLRRRFPGKTRIGLIHRAPRPLPDAAESARLKQLGFELTIVECSGADKLLAAFVSLQGKADFAVTEPDSALYNSATVKPLVIASLEHRLPVVGFSAAFVGAGALVGVYPDFNDLGRQTGEMMLRILAGKASGEEDPRKVVVSINQRISRLIGMEPSDLKDALILR